MEYKNEKAFSEAIVAFEKKYAWTLLAKRARLWDRFWVYAPRKGMMQVVIICVFLLGGGVLFYMGNIWSSIICMAIAAIIVRVRLKDTDKRRIFLKRKELANKLSKQLNFEITSKEQELLSLQMKKEKILAGDASMMHEQNIFPFMEPEKLQLYWEKVVQPHIVLDIDRQIKEVSELLDYIKAEKTFLTEIE